MLGQLSELGFGPDRVATLALHVDYFDKPWKDPFSDPLFSEREAQYSRIYHGLNKDSKPDVLYFTPMIIVDGRYPQLGSGAENKAKLKASLQKALAEKPEVSLKLALEDDKAGAGRKKLSVTVKSLTPRMAGHDLLIGAAIYQDRVETKVESGELAGKTYINNHVVRKLALEVARPTARGTTLKMPLELAEGCEPGKCGVTAFAQDEKTGRIYQAATIRWKADPEP